MSPNEENIPSKEELIFKKVEIPYRQTKEEIWDQLESKLEEPESHEKKQTKIIQMSWSRLAAAVTIIVGGTILFAMNYTVSVTSMAASYETVVLPDNSTVLLNAESTVSYRPYWWKVRREVDFEGEGFFEVEKGSRFDVNSGEFRTTVLGTSFNISTRNKFYKVFCKTGRVGVNYLPLGDRKIIEPNNMIIFSTETLMRRFIENANVDIELGWTMDKFSFNAEPLDFVLEELERQYDVEINVDPKLVDKRTYTGYFTKKQSIESTLELICESFGLTFIAEENKEPKSYRIKIPDDQ